MTQKLTNVFSVIPHKIITNYNNDDIFSKPCHSLLTATAAVVTPNRVICQVVMVAMLAVVDPSLHLYHTLNILHIHCLRRTISYNMSIISIMSSA